MHSPSIAPTEVEHNNTSSQSSSQLDVGIAISDRQEVLLHGPPSLTSSQGNLQPPRKRVKMPEPLLDSIISGTKEDPSKDSSEEGFLTPDGTRTFPLTYQYQRTATDSGDGVSVHVVNQVFKVVAVQTDHRHIARLVLEGERRSFRSLKQDRNVDAALTAIS